MLNKEKQIIQQAPASLQTIFGQANKANNECPLTAAFMACFVFPAVREALSPQSKSAFVVITSYNGGIGSNYWKFYLIKTSFTLGEWVSLVKVFRLFRLELICFGAQSVDTVVGRCTTSSLSIGRASVFVMPCYYYQFLKNQT